MKTFEDLVAGRVPCHKLWEDEHHLAFLAPSPVARGHTILVTKRVAPYVFELSADEHAALWDAARVVAQHLKRVLPCERVCIGVVGWEVRHVHVHLVPTNAPGQYPPLGGAPASETELAALQRALTFTSGRAAR